MHISSDVMEDSIDYTQQLNQSEQISIMGGERDGCAIMAAHRKLVRDALGPNEQNDADLMYVKPDHFIYQQPR